MPGSNVLHTHRALQPCQCLFPCIYSDIYATHFRLKNPSNQPPQCCDCNVTPLLNSAERRFLSCISWRLCARSLGPSLTTLFLQLRIFSADTTSGTVVSQFFRTKLPMYLMILFPFWIFFSQQCSPSDNIMQIMECPHRDLKHPVIRTVHNTSCQSSTLIPRLPCFCKFAECDGAVVDSRTFDRHKRNDLSKYVQDTIAAATTACKSQDNAIAEHLTSLSLSYDRLINSNSTAPLHQSTTSTSGKRTEQKLIEKTLCQLCDIETLLEDLIASVYGNLDGIGTPSGVVQFPLVWHLSYHHVTLSQRYKCWDNTIEFFMVSLVLFCSTAFVL